MSQGKPGFISSNEFFMKILGNNATIRLCVEDDTFPWAHEAGVYIPSSGDLFVTSNRLTGPGQEQTVVITRVNVRKEPPIREEIDCGIAMANGGVNYKAGVLFCGQGTVNTPSGLFYMKAEAPYQTTTLIDSFNGRQFNSPNDVVVHNDGSIWFTDPIYGFEQGFRPAPQLPNQVYRYQPRTKSIRAMADGFGRPNGISFSPDQSTVYVTDTDFIHGDGTTDPLRPAAM
jgi:gluconolactonase